MPGAYRSCLTRMIPIAAARRRRRGARAARACLALILSLAPGFAARASAHDGLPVAGWLERARVSPGDIVLEAKLDTGARTSSIHAVNLRRFTRDGEEWVAFDVPGDDGRSAHVERPLVRVARIQSAPGVDETRPIVRLGICVGSVYRVTEVSLVDRSSLAKPLLLGRRFLRGRLLVDLSGRYLLEPACKRKAIR